MRVDLQGLGSYKYECDDPECFYCEKYGIVKNKPINIDRIFYIKLNINPYRWTERETNNLREVIYMNPRDIKQLFPGRTLGSLYDKQHRLRKLLINNY